jgi:YVTN family beta-propeller protein
LLTALLVLAVIAAGVLAFWPRPHASSVVLTAPVPNDPTAILVAGHNVWVASQGAGVVSVLDRESGHVTQTIRTGGSPARLAPAAGGVWVADTSGASLVPVTARPPRRYARIAAGADVSDVAFARGAVWWASSAEGVVRVRGRDPGSEQSLGVGARPIALAGDRRWVAVANAGDGTLARIDAGARRLAGPPVRVGGTPVDVAVDGDTAWVLDASTDSVVSVDLRRGTLVKRIAVGRQPVAVAADGDDVYVVSAGDRELVHLSATSGHVQSRTRIGQAPAALALDPAHVWVTDIGDDTVTRYDR